MGKFKALYIYRRCIGYLRSPRIWTL